MFTNYDFKIIYDSDEDDIIKSFYSPLISNAITYKRVVGFFDSSLFFHTSENLVRFFEKGGKLEYIICNEIPQKEFDAISEGYELKKIQEKTIENFKNGLDKIKSLLDEENKRATTFLIENNMLDIKIGLKSGGKLHSKLLICEDEAKNKIVTAGSNNETSAAATKNDESFDCFCSWKENDRPRLIKHESKINAFFDKKSKKTKIVEFEEAKKDELIEIIKRNTKPLKKKIAQINIPKAPEKINDEKFVIRDYQKEALRKWRDNKYKGVLNMCTSSGKTITAIHGIKTIFDDRSEKKESFFVIIAVPYEALALQWVEELELFNIFPIKCWGGYKNWETELNDSIAEYNFKVSQGKSVFKCVLVINRSLQTEKFYKQIKLISKNLLFISDECHHHNTENIINVLPDAQFRLGISATPKHYLDDEKNERLFEYYKKEVFDFTLEDAIEEKILTPYKYYIFKVKPTEKELDDIISVQNKISKIQAIIQNNKNSEMEEQLNQLYNEKSIILGTLENKLRVLETYLKNNKPENFTLFYVSKDFKSNGEEQQIAKTTKLLKKYKWNVSKFTSQENKKKRVEILKDFKMTNFHALVAIKCLDEGINVPNCKIAFLISSSKNPREFIQRRGRILRKSKNKKESIIFDFIIDIDKRYETQKVGKQITESEIDRINEFSKLSDNSLEAIEEVRPLAEKWGLDQLL